MAVTYNTSTINDRLQAVVDNIDANGSGYLKLLASGGVVISSIQLGVPCGTVSGGVLTFGGTLFDPAATATGYAISGVIQDAIGTTVVSGLSVGIPLSGGDILISNGLSTTLITAGQTLQVLSAQITGS
jgi:hypothetical protein